MASFKIEVSNDSVSFAAAKTSKGIELTSERIMSGWFDFFTVIEGNLKIKGIEVLAQKLESVTSSLEKLGAKSIRFSCSDWTKPVTLELHQIYNLVWFVSLRAVVKAEDTEERGKRLKEVEL